MDKSLPRKIFPIGWKHYWPIQGPYTEPFSGSDNERTYTATSNILKTRFSNIKWRWLNETIEYHVNSNGLRNSFDMDEDYDFSDKYVVLGCSHVEGIGSPSHQTIPGFIQQKTGIQTINMGNGGCGCDIVFYNAMWLSTVKSPPKKIFILWPAVNRFSYFDLKYDEEEFIKASNGSSFVNPFLIQNCDSVRMFKENYKINLMANPVVQASNKLLWQKLLKSVWGNRMVELDVIDGSEENQTYQGKEFANEVLKLDERLKCKDPEELLNDWCARDITKESVKVVVRSIDKSAGHGLNCHWGWRINDSISDWFISE